MIDRFVVVLSNQLLVLVLIVAVRSLGLRIGNFFSKSKGCIFQEKHFDKLPRNYVCGACGTTNKLNSNYCINCGGKLI